MVSVINSPLITKGRLFIHPPQKSDRFKKEGLIFFVPIFPGLETDFQKKSHFFFLPMATPFPIRFPTPQKKTNENGNRMTYIFFSVLPAVLTGRHLFFPYMFF